MSPGLLWEEVERAQATGDIVEMDHELVTTNGRHELRRILGPLDTTCIVVGAIIGVGIFFTPSRVAALAGSVELTLLVWAAGGSGTSAVLVRRMAACLMDRR